ncbi:MAG: hypothetical protein J0I68_04185 [Achromobacter sp.]|jgi:hypothetical protein|uniref:Lipocalin-like domain-containing protein n=4 Tax=Achromobacter insuavis TaxID=1287735 RepID=A0A6J5A413_9BURK|nr:MULTISPECIES: hypothetical protein [Achromobacter]MBN9637706.1 hypothetical protein [Achromobacter sp.]MCG2599193.1 hypothetical protein [Achromobacter sp.]MCG2601905.1 hypothetical protein [Achromobacter sp.]CAB3633622.1 hypothetical protein LMG26845_01262 [Achromobacter insuavis]CAB3891052.1 hypothetical protein LMG26846_04001 [Achromobacter insuavis]
MKLLRLYALAALLGGTALLPAAAPAQPPTQQAAAQALVGKWRHQTMLRTVDGQALPPQPSGGAGVAEFRSDGTWSMQGPGALSSGTYRWLDAKRIEQTLERSTSEYEIGEASIRYVKIQGDHLTLTRVQDRKEMDRLMPPATPGTKRPDQMIVTNLFTRLPAD